MKDVRIWAVLVLCSAVLSWQVLLAQEGAGDAPAKPAKAKTAPDKPAGGKTATAVPEGAIKLAFEVSADMAGIFTPRKLVATQSFSFMGGSGKLNILGKDYAISGQIVGKKGWFGIDVNGDEKLAGNEMKNVVPNQMMVFRIKLEDKKEFVVVIKNCTITAMQGGGVSTSGDCYAACGYKGTVGKTVVRIIDDNMDGKITQDGGDAIAIGTSKCAMPFHKTHMIGGALYEIQVAEDLTSMTCTKVADTKLIPVKSPLLRAAALKSLVLVDESTDQAFDLATNRSGIPAGEYSLVYGVLEAKGVVVIRPGKDMKKITISDSSADLGIGPPPKLLFSGAVLGGKVVIAPTVAVVGSGGEMYQPDFGSTNGAPTVILSEGNRVLAKDTMSYG